MIDLFTSHAQLLLCRTQSLLTPQEIIEFLPFFSCKVIKGPHETSCVNCFANSSYTGFMWSSAFYAFAMHNQPSSVRNMKCTSFPEPVGSPTRSFYLLTGLCDASRPPDACLLALPSFPHLLPNYCFIQRFLGACLLSSGRAKVH